MSVFLGMPLCVLPAISFGATCDRGRHLILTREARSVGHAAVWSLCRTSEAALLLFSVSNRTTHADHTGGGGLREST